MLVFQKFSLILSILLSISTCTNPTERTAKGAVNRLNSKGLRLKIVNHEEFRWAVVVGINYDRSTVSSKLSKARNDAIAMGNMLDDKGRFQVVRLTDESRPDLGAYDPNLPTKNNIEKAVDDLIVKADKDDMIVFFFSGHGVSDKQGNNYLLPVDVRMDSNETIYSTSVKVEDIVKKLADKGFDKTLLVLDACREQLATGKNSKSVISDSDFRFRVKPYSDSSVAISYFCTSEKLLCYEDPNSSYGVFTRYLLEGLRGNADTNRDKLVTFKELSAYAHKNIKTWSMKNPDSFQKPSVKYNKNETYGDLALTVTDLPEKSYRMILLHAQGDITANSKTPLMGKYISPEEQIHISGDGSYANFIIYPYKEYVSLTAEKDSKFSYRIVNKKDIEILVTKGSVKVYRNKTKTIRKIKIITPINIISSSQDGTQFGVDARKDNALAKVFQGQAKVRFSMPYSLENLPKETLTKTGLTRIQQQYFARDQKTLTAGNQIPMTTSTREMVIKNNYKLNELFDSLEVQEFARKPNPQNYSSIQEKTSLY